MEDEAELVLQKRQLRPDELPELDEDLADEELPVDEADEPDEVADEFDPLRVLSRISLMAFSARNLTVLFVCRDEMDDALRRRCLSIRRRLRARSWREGVA